jgi:nitric oxide reductase subunit B
MKPEAINTERLSPWWRYSVVIVLAIGFAILIWMTIAAHLNAPPIPEKVVNPSGEHVFARKDILAGQQVFLRYGGTAPIWGRTFRPSISIRLPSMLARHWQNRILTGD